MGWKKPDLQIRLEAEGWTFLENEPAADNDSDSGLPGSVAAAPIGRRVIVPTRSELQERYRTVYKEVRLEEACDICGYPLSGAEIVAVYARGRIKPEQR